jgi:hypothetical protein
MIRQAKAAGTIPVVSTIIPVNPAYVDRLADERNFWVDETNAALVPMARAEGAIVADLNAAMKAESPDLPELFTDHVHPNDRGYGAMADAFFRALTQPVGTTPAASYAICFAPRLTWCPIWNSSSYGWKSIRCQTLPRTERLHTCGTF